MTALHVQLYSCLAWSEAICPDTPKGGTTYGKVRLPNFKMEVAYTSQRPRAKSDITIVTQCSVDRYDAWSSWNSIREVWGFPSDVDVDVHVHIGKLERALFRADFCSAAHR